MTLEILQKIGLSQGEIKVYSALLAVGSSPINKIHEKTGIERRNIYDILNKLIERGLVTYITENKKRFFQLSHPNKIIEYIESKESEMGRTKKQITKLIPDIIKKFEFRQPEVKAEIFRGAEGIKAVWEDMLNYKENYWIGSGRYVPKQFPHFFTSWNKRRIKLKVKWFNLARTEMRREIRKPFSLEQIKFLPVEFSINPAVVAIYGNKVANFLYGETSFAVVIENKEMAENYKMYHRYLWENVAKN
jgi:sugar-specific transcriptional regulator TrmB